MDDDSKDWKNKTCTINACGRNQYIKKRGWCKIHYERWQYRRGDPEPVFEHQEKGHGMVKTPEWRAWRAMRVRCSQPTHPKWKDYGGRGIRVCDEWQKSFLAFYEHIGAKPGKGYSLDRVDNNGNYEPGNVRWATYIEQNNNQRRSKKYANIDI